MQVLTERQADILEYLKNRIKGGQPPSLREIMTKFKFKGIRAAEDHLKALQEKGYIKKIKGMARSIEVLGLKKIDAIELPVLGRIAAGSPILAEENMEGTIAVDRSWVKNENSFILKVKGESMISAGIHDGDYAIVKQEYTAENNDIVAVMLDDEVTLKRFFKRDSRIILKPENPSMKPITIKQGDIRVRIIGKLVGVYRKI